MKDSNDYSIHGFSNVFAVGNAVTGRGNIQESKKHGNLITNKIIDEHLKHDDFFEEWLINYNNNLKNKVQEQIDKIELEIKSKEIMPDHIIQNILDKTKSLQDKAGYISYSKWIKLKTPSRLEDMLNK